VEKNPSKSWKAVSLLALVIMVVIVVIAGATGNWFLTALPIGFLFGFFLEKADLCGSSAFSEAFMFKDWRKIQGLWVLIVVSMVGFALLSWLGLVKLSPRPLEWATMLVGGLVFGSGMVLAGGCISGALYKSGAGNLNSMAALVGIPLGVGLVEYGPLHGFYQFLKQYVIKSHDGGPVTLSSLTGLPFGVLAVLFAVVTLGFAFWMLKKKPSAPSSPAKADAPQSGLLTRIATRPWKPWQAGIAIGVLAWFGYMSRAASGTNYPLGVTHGVLQTQLLLTDYPLKIITTPAPPSPTPTPEASPAPVKKASLWLILEVMALVLGSHVSARLTGRFRLLPKPPDETIIAFFGGIITGAGAGIAGYCVVGGIMSGWALMSVASLIFGLATIAANWSMTYLYMMGGQRR
jgi:uncharacterized membrane protein YedE/YeeE